MPDAMEVETPPAAAAPSIVAELHASFTLIERFVSSREPRLMAQALKVLGPVRKAGKESPSRLVAALSAASSVYVPAATPLKGPLAELLASLPQPSAEEVAASAMPPEDEAEKKEKEEKAKKAAAEAGDKEKKEAEKENKEKEKPVEKKPPAKLPESELLVALLALLLLLDTGKSTAAMPWALQLMERIASLKRRTTLDPIAERIYFYASWAFETCGQLAALRSPLLAAHRTATLHHNTTCQATLLNCLLRNFLHYKLFDQAEKLLTKTTFPEQVIKEARSAHRPLAPLSLSLLSYRHPLLPFTRRRTRSSRDTSTTRAASRRCSLSTPRPTDASYRPSARRPPQRPWASA